MCKSATADEAANVWTHTRAPHVRNGSTADTTPMSALGGKRTLAASGYRSYSSVSNLPSEQSYCAAIPAPTLPSYGLHLLLPVQHGHCAPLLPFAHTSRSHTGFDRPDALPRRPWRSTRRSPRMVRQQPLFSLTTGCLRRRTVRREAHQQKRPECRTQAHDDLLTAQPLMSATGGKRTSAVTQTNAVA